jgi:hypothetical protein
MANNRRDRTKDASGSSERPKSVGGSTANSPEPEIVSETVSPAPGLSSTAPATPARGDIWVSLLESSPWSNSHGGRIEVAPTPPAPPRLQDPPPVGNLVSRWSQPIWRTQTHVEGEEIGGDSIVTDSVSSSPVTSDSVLTVSDLVVEVEPAQNIEPEEPAESEPEQPVAYEPGTTSLAQLVEMAEGITYPESNPADVRPSEYLIEVPEEFTVVGTADASDSDVTPVEEATPQPEVEPLAVAIEADPVEEVVPQPVLVIVPPQVVQVSASMPAEPMPSPASGSHLADLMAAVAVKAPAASVAKPARAPRKFTAQVKKSASVQEVPVEDLLGGVFGVASSAVRGVFSIGAGLVDGVVKGGRIVGSNVVAGTRRLAGTIEQSCGSCSSSKCDVDVTKNRKTN